MSKKDKKANGKTSYIFTRETLGMTLLLFTAVTFIMLCSGSVIFWDIGKAVCTFLYGTFGYGSFLILGLLAYLGEWLVFEKKIKISFRKAITLSLTVFSLFLLFHAVSTGGYALEGYGKYISDCYSNAQNGFAGYTFGGVISAIFVYPVARAGGFVTAYVLFSILAVPFGYLTFTAFAGGKLASRVKAPAISEANEEVAEPAPVQPVAIREVAVAEVPEVQTIEPQTAQRPVAVTKPSDGTRDEKFSSRNLGRKILFEKGEFAAESYRRNMIFNENSYFNHPTTSEADYLSSFSTKPNKTYTENYQEEVYNQQQTMPSSYVYGEKPVEEIPAYDDDRYAYGNAEERETAPVQPSPQAPHIAEPVNDYYRNEISDRPERPVNPYGLDDVPAPKQEERAVYEAPAQPVVNEPEPEDPFTRTRDRGLTVRGGETAEEKIVTDKEEPENDDVYGFLTNGDRSGRVNEQPQPRGKADIFDDDDEDEITEIKEDVFSRRRVETPPAPVRRESKPAEPVKSQSAETQPKPEEKTEEKPKHVWKKYVRPSLDLLDDYPENANVNTGEIEDNKRTIVDALAQYKIASEVANVTIGPAITRYDVIIEDKTNIKRSLSYRDAIAMDLRKDNVTAYLNYTKGALSIEVPNNKRSVVGLKTMLTSPKFINSKSESLTFALGKNVEGEVVCPDITKMPHLLVAGTTGSGKSICLSALLVSLLYKYGPEELRLILVDPKQVEFISYDKLPHLMINEIIYEFDKAIKALNWAIKEMERRYSLFKEMTEAGVATKNLDEYNENLTEGEERLPKIVIVLDEFGDLMLQAKKDIEGKIIKLVQKARACGIHLILATQRPSVDCITGLIKSNLPTRIGFKVNSFDDSRTIFDIGGAEKLLGKGDSYFRSAENPELTRIQGCFVGSKEVQRVCDFVKANNETYFDQSVSDFINTVEQEEKPNVMSGGNDEEVSEIKIDDTHIKALKYCVTSNMASVSMLQRRFPVGYIKACKIIDWMENMNYVTPSEGSKPRKVLLSKEEFESIYGDVDD